MKVLIPAAVNGTPGSFPLAAVGKFFLCNGTTGTFRARLGETDIAINNPGDGFGSANDVPFSKLFLYNDGPAAVTADISVTTERVNVATTSVSNAVNTASVITNILTSCTEAVPAQFLKTGNVGGPQALAGAPSYFRWALVMGFKDLAGTPNAANVKLGYAAAANQQPITIAPGDIFALPIPDGCKVNFQNLYLAITNAGDGLVVLFV